MTKALPPQRGLTLLPEATEAQQEPPSILARLYARFQMGNGPLPYTTQWLPTASLQVRGGEQVRGKGAFTDNFNLVGVLHPPSVEARSQGLSGDYVYTVVTGRRRVLSALEAGMEQMECHVYGPLTPAQQALLVLSENWHRSPAWVMELHAVREFVTGQVPLSDEELAEALGVSVTIVREHLKLARVSPALLDLGLASGLDQATMRQLTRLTPSAAQALVEEKLSLTAEDVQQALRGQFAVLSPALEGMDWEEEEAEGEPAPEEQSRSRTKKRDASRPRSTPPPDDRSISPDSVASLLQQMQADLTSYRVRAQAVAQTVSRPLPFQRLILQLRACEQAIAQCQAVGLAVSPHTKVSEQE